MLDELLLGGEVQESSKKNVLKAIAAQDLLQEVYVHIVMLPPLIGGNIKRCFCLTSVCLTSVCLMSVAYIGPKWRTERPRKTKIGTEVAHVTRDSDITFKVKRSRSQAGLLSSQRVNVLSVGNCCYIAVCRRIKRCFCLTSV